MTGREGTEKAPPSIKKCSRSEDRLRTDGDGRATTVFLQKHRVEQDYIVNE